MYNIHGLAGSQGSLSIPPIHKDVPGYRGSNEFICKCIPILLLQKLISTSHNSIRRQKDHHGPPARDWSLVPTKVQEHLPQENPLQARADAELATEIQRG